MSETSVKIIKNESTKVQTLGANNYGCAKELLYVRDDLRKRTR